MSDTAKPQAIQQKSGLRIPGFAQLQRLGKSLMLPIAVLPAAGILLRLGQDDLLGRIHAPVIGSFFKAMTAAGDALFSNLPLIFAVGVAIGFARKSDGSTALAAVVGFLVFSGVLKAFGPMVQVDTACAGAACKMQRDAPDAGVIGGIVIGLTAAILWQRYYRVKLVPWLPFLRRRRFVPIIMSLAGLALGVVFGLIWPPINTQLSDFATWLYDHGTWGAGIYG